MVTALGDLEISAGAGDVVVKGSAVSSQSDVAISAGRDVRLEAAQNTSEDSRVDKKSGFFAETGNMGLRHQLVDPGHLGRVRPERFH